jgi:hypothetical protein
MKCVIAPLLLALAMAGCQNTADKQPAELSLGHATLQQIAATTTSQIHLQPNPPGPYRLFKLTPRK